MWTNGSRWLSGTPAKARRTGKPSPSNPLGAVVTETTLRGWSVGAGAGVCGSTSRLSTVTAGMVPPTVARATFFQPLPGHPRDERELARLGDEPARHVPHLAVLLEEPGGDEAGRELAAQPAGGRAGA